ncbi:MAG: DNA replication/repair protein RecF [Rickettsiaceae bacterium]
MRNVYLEHLSLNNYRNFSELSLAFLSGVNIIVGPNGSGKTNILEAISLLSPGKGLKSANFDEICRYGFGSWKTECRLQSKLGVAEIETTFNSQERNRKINYNGSKVSSGELLNLLNLIWVTPQMEGIFAGPASVRRRFLDRIVYNFYPAHAKRLAKYEHFMKERNKALSQRGWESQGSWLSTVEEKMTEEAIIIEKARSETVYYMQQAINNLATDFPKAKLVLSELSDQQGQWSSFAEAYAEMLLKGRTKDSYAGRTTFGVHRSDLNVFHSEKQRLAKFCSTGEQKAMLVSIILSSVESILKNTGCSPVLLLDELFVHLDEVRKKQLANYITSTNLQTLVTTTDIVGMEYLAAKSKVIEL